MKWQEKQRMYKLQIKQVLLYHLLDKHENGDNSKLNFLQNSIKYLALNVTVKRNLQTKLCNNSECGFTTLK